MDETLENPSGQDVASGDGGLTSDTTDTTTKPTAPVLETSAESLVATSGTSLVIRFTIPTDCTLEVENVDNKGSILVKDNTAAFSPHTPDTDEVVNFKAYSVSADSVKSDALEFQVTVKAATTDTGDTGEATVLNSGVKLPFTELELAVGNKKKIQLTASRADYEFADIPVTGGIELQDYTGNEVTLTQTANNEFELSAEAATLNPLDLTIVVKAQENVYTTVSLQLTIKAAADFIDCDVSGDIELCPGNTVSFTLTGNDAQTVTKVPDNLITDSPVKINTADLTVTCNTIGTFYQSFNVTKGDLTRTIQVKVICSNIITVDTESVSVSLLETATVGVTLVGTEYTVEIEDKSVLEVTKESTSFTIKPLSAGSTKITLTGNRGQLTQKAYVNVEIRDVTYPTTPVLTTEKAEVQGGENIYLTFDIGKKGDTLSARLGESTTGSLVVENNVVTYVAYTPDTDNTIMIYVKTTSVDGITSDEVAVSVKVKGIPDTQLKVPATITVAEGETKALGIVTNGTSISLASTVPEFLKVNSTKKTVTGVKYGTVVVTVTAKAVNARAVTKEITVTVEPGKVNKPALSTVLRSVEEGKVLSLAFIVDEDTTLQARETTGAGTLEITGNNVVNWTAPIITEEERQTYTMEVYSVRNVVNVQSDKLVFNVVVLKAKEVDTSDDTTGEEDTTGKITYSELNSVLRSDTLTFEDKVSIIKTRGQGLAVTTLNRLLSYETVMNSANKTLTSTVGAAKNYELYMAIRTVLELTDNDKFQSLFSLLNLVFKEYASDAFSSVKMNRFDREWTGGDKNKYSFQNITTLLTMLCDITKRASNLNRVDFSIVFDKEKTVFTDRIKESIIKYYTL